MICEILSSEYRFYLESSHWLCCKSPLQSLWKSGNTPNLFYTKHHHIQYLCITARIRKQSYFDCAEKLAAAYMAASTSTLSWESRLWRILWWAFFLSGMMEAKLPSILKRNKRKIDEFKSQIIWKACKEKYNIAGSLLFLT